MNFKQFLKPSWKKIIAFFVLLILNLYYFIPKSFYYPNNNCESTISNGTSTIFKECLSFMKIDYLQLSFYIGISIVMSYFLSCLVFSIYDRKK